jgi:hypothetical protein
MDNRARSWWPGAERTREYYNLDSRSNRPLSTWRQGDKRVSLVGWPPGQYRTQGMREEESDFRALFGFSPVRAVTRVQPERLLVRCDSINELFPG